MMFFLLSVVLKFWSELYIVLLRIGSLTGRGLKTTEAQVSLAVSIHLLSIIAMLLALSS